MSCRPKKICHQELNGLYEHLFCFFGNLNWWPGDTKEEIIVGAVLTQNTNWKNVEKAITNLKNENLLNFQNILDADFCNLATAIKPSGFFNQKSERLKFIAKFMLENGFPDVLLEEGESFRKKLLSVKGIGPETADSILLYAFESPFFVVDAYTRRIFERHGVFEGGERYDDIAKCFVENLKKDIFTYNQYHAMIVETAKRWCFKKNPKCESCPVNVFGAKENTQTNKAMCEVS